MSEDELLVALILSKTVKKKSQKPKIRIGKIRRHTFSKSKKKKLEEIFTK